MTKTVKLRMGQSLVDVPIDSMKAIQAVMRTMHKAKVLGYRSRQEGWQWRQVAKDENGSSEK